MLRSARSTAAVEQMLPIPYDGAPMMVRGVNNRDDARAAIAAWKNGGMPGRDLALLPSDLGNYQNHGNAEMAEAFNQRYQHFFMPGFSIDNVDYRRSVIHVWKELTNS